MGKPLTIKEEDDLRLLQLKKQMRAKSKVDVLRSALSLLEQEVEKQLRIKKWKKAAQIIGDSSLEVLEDFQIPKRFERLP